MSSSSNLFHDYLLPEMRDEIRRRALGSACLMLSMTCQAENQLELSLIGSRQDLFALLAHDGALRLAKMRLAAEEDCRKHLRAHDLLHVALSHGWVSFSRWLLTFDDMNVCARCIYDAIRSGRQDAQMVALVTHLGQQCQEDGGMDTITFTSAFFGIEAFLHLAPPLLASYDTFAARFGLRPKSVRRHFAVNARVIAWLAKRDGHLPLPLWLDIILGVFFPKKGGGIQPAHATSDIACFAFQDSRFGMTLAEGFRSQMHTLLVGSQRRITPFWAELLREGAQRTENVDYLQWLDTFL